MSGTALLYQRTDGLLYVSSFSRNREGWSVVNGWYRMVPAEAPDEQLGALILEGVRIGGEPVDIPAEESQEYLEPLLRAAKVRSFTAFTKDARAVSIATDKFGGYFVSPMRNPNRRRGNSLLVIAEKELTVAADPSAEEIGRIAREGLALSVVE